MSILHTDNPTTSFGGPRHPVAIALAAPVDNLSTVEADTATGWLISEAELRSRQEEISFIDGLLGLGSVESDDDASNLTANGSTPSSADTIFLGGRSHEQLRHLCKQILVQRVPGIEVRYWDLAILAINLVFLFFLMIKCRNLRRKSRYLDSPVFRAFFVLIYAITLLNVVHSGTSIAISISNPFGVLVDQILWLCLKFCTLTAELSVLFFGLLFGRWDSQASVCRAFFLTALISGVHSAAQAVLEFEIVDERFIIDSLRIYAHGGMSFWFLSSLFFAILYAVVCFIPVLCCRVRSYRCSFFFYCLLMTMMNVVQAFSALLIQLDNADGMCLADVTTFSYFSLFAPFVYFVFLRYSLKSKRIPYRHKTHHENAEINGYCPRFSGLLSPSYDDLFERDNPHVANILHLNYEFFHATHDFQNPLSSHTVPLMGTSTTPDSTLTTHMDSDAANQEMGDLSTSSESRPIIGAPYSSYSRPKQLSMRGDGRLTFSSAHS